MGSARDWEGPAGSDTADEPRESAVGCAEDPRRAVEARPDCLAGDGVEVHGPASEAAVAGVANILEEPRPGSHRVGFLHGTYRDLSSPVRAHCADPQPASASAFQCHGAFDCRMDGAPTARGVRAGGGAPVSDSGPRPSLWRTIFASGPRRPTQVFVMEPTHARHLHYTALARRLHSSRPRCVFSQG